MDDQNNVTKELATLLPALPVAAKTSAIKAFSQLIGGAGAYVIAWLRRPTQAIEDKTDAKSLMIRKISEAAAKRASEDPEIIEQAIAQWLPGELRKQENKQKVAELAFQGILEFDATQYQSNDSIIEDDWLNAFERFSEDASSENMRTLWGKVLSGEIVNPGSFSKTTLRFISELDQRTALDFENVAKYAIAGQAMGVPDDNPAIFNSMLHLDSVGILSGVGGLVQWQGRSNENGQFGVHGERFGLIGLTEPNTEVTIDSAPYTVTGRQLLKIVPNPDEEQCVISLSEKLKEPTGFSRTIIKGAALGRVIYEDGKRSLKLDRLIWGENPFSEKRIES